MAYITARNNHFYVVTYDGIDPITNKERRRWIPAGKSRTDAEAIATTINNTTPPVPRASTGDLTLGQYLRTTWLPKRQRRVRETTAYRYSWMIDRYIVPSLGQLPLRSVRTEHIDDLYFELATTGGRNQTGLAPKTVYEVHMIVRSALTETSRSRLTRTNPTDDAQAPRPHRLPRTGAEVWTAPQLGDFLDAAKGQRLYPTLHLTATTGMRRGEVVGLRWGDWNQQTHSLSISRSRQVVRGQSTEFATKTRTSRRCIDLDPKTEAVLQEWQQRQHDDGHPVTPRDPMFTNTKGKPLHAESVSQLFGRIIGYTNLPRIRFHDLRHTHASLMVASGVPIKVVSERLGHAHPGFTMATYQHVLPGMGAAAAQGFADMLEPVDQQEPQMEPKAQVNEGDKHKKDSPDLPNR